LVLISARAYPRNPFSSPIEKQPRTLEGVNFKR